MLSVLTDLIAACHKIIDSDGEVFGFFKACSAPPVNHLEAQQLVLAVHIVRVVVKCDCAGLHLCLTGKCFSCSTGP